MYLLDTNHISRLRQDDQRLQLRIADATQPIAISVIVRGELRFMVEHSIERERNQQRLETVLANIPIIPIDEDVADWYGDLKTALFRRFGHKDPAKRRKATLASLGVSDNDLWIAATAKRQGAIIVSGDTDFKRIAEVTDLQIETWITSPT
ncbi:MAG: type II toxin-antitoxin system VapC family toxin [Blastochloris sp.]|nr:type II toxin-antitoxin system VapC family toxin [Blastochloris sp.]